MTKLLIVLGSLGVLVIATAGAFWGYREYDGRGRAHEVPGGVLLVSARPDASMLALGGGVVTLVGGCLGVGDHVVIWPFGTEVVDEDPLQIAVPGSGRVGLGDRVTYGGGFVIEHSSDDVEPGPLDIAGVTVPARCAEHDIFLAS